MRRKLHLCALAGLLLFGGGAVAFSHIENHSVRQLDYAIVSDADLGPPADLVHRPSDDFRSLAPSERERGFTFMDSGKSHAAIPGRRIPELVLLSELASMQWTNRAVPLPRANTLAHINFQQRRFGRLPSDSGGIEFFNPEVILVKFRDWPHVCAVRVEPMRELAAVQLLTGRPEVEFAVLDTFERRQFSPNDPLLSMQWHHAVIGSFQAWNYGLGQSSVRVAIVDTPFQMNHPDLVANTDDGWDVVTNGPVTSAPGIVHSTLCAGMTAAVINNGAGVAGAANCRVLPININGAISEMYNATIWAADHGVRVVNISWSGGTDPVLEAAGNYLKTNAGGILVMSAYDGNGSLSGPNQPDVYCISMTDAADNFQGSLAGAYIDFCAPGYQVYSTTTTGGYAYGTGCSFAAPLVCGVIAWIMGLNPTLGPDDIIGILKSTAVDLGPTGWDQFYGWGRINFIAAATAAVATLPNISSVRWINNQVAVSANYRPGLNYSLWRAPQLTTPSWSEVANLVTATNGNVITLTDPAPVANQAFYRVQAISR